MSSTYIRSRLFEHSQEEGTLELDKAYSLALAIHTAQVDSASYQQPNVGIAAAIKDESGSGDEKPMMAATQTVSLCYYCGRLYHEKSKCPAKRSNCRKCGRLGHWAVVCRSKVRPTELSGGKSLISAAMDPMLCAVPGSLLLASVPVKINGICFDGLMDSCSSESYSKTCNTGISM